METKDYHGSIKIIVPGIPIDIYDEVKKVIETNVESFNESLESSVREAAEQKGYEAESFDQKVDPEEKKGEDVVSMLKMAALMISLMPKEDQEQAKRELFDVLRKAGAADCDCPKCKENRKMH